MVGIITDGDIRRALEKKGNKIFDQTADNLMSKIRNGFLQTL